MSIFILACMPSLGLRLRPPESYITPLPTRTRWPVAPFGAYVRRTIRGGSTLPWLTPTMPPHPIACSWSRLNTSMPRPESAATSVARSAIWRAVRCPGGVLARSRASEAARAITVPRSTPRRTPALRLSPATSDTDVMVDAPDGSVLSPRYRYAARRAPSTTACAAVRASMPSRSARVVATVDRLPAERTSAAAALRNVFAVSASGSPMPSATWVGPVAVGITST